MADNLGEFSLAWKDENSDDWIDGDIYTYTHTNICTLKAQIYTVCSVLVATRHTSKRSGGRWFEFSSFQVAINKQ